MTRADKVLLAVLACAALLASPVAAAHATRGGQAAYAVVAGPAGTKHLPLAEDGSYVVQGLRGRVVVAVEHGSVRITESTCRDQVCVHTKAASRPGEAIACVPNGVSVTVEGGARELDAVVR
ncbi:NusG domain II-containing protein [Coriobacteriia bacterium Es71-Z0120]|uniref:NusG domain II-containing protein n=1 Tax=Parvivirga hydrogeniphila TaxID=2939460 RepID=UPI002260D4ED|nr:NusG domain II-containing protein [Parvivirga hydrogeniphila]MCL4078958.1 NusG domain II-containing protein [Parvivirga hydrogeniphila]